MGNIRIQDVPQRIQYEATAPTQSVFPIPFPFLANSDIVVWQDDVLLAQGGAPGQYGLTGAGSATGGVLTLVTAAPVGTIITIIGSTPIDRTSIYSPTISNLTGDDLNSDFNRIIIMLQEVWTIQNYMMLQYKPYLELSQDIDVTKDRWLPILPPLYAWRMNAANTAIEAWDTTTGGGGGSGSQVIIVINQPAHGFAANEVVYHNGVEFALANASTAATGEACGLVVSVLDANSFNLLVCGQFNGAFTEGDVLFLSDTVDGELTNVEPTTVGHISKPLAIAISPTEAAFFNMRGKIISETFSSWEGVAVNTALVANTGYYLTGGGALLMTLPVTAPAGTTIRIAGFASTSWRIVQNAGQSINFGNLTTTVGAGGYIESQDPSDAIEILCVVANTTWTVLSSVGNLTVI